MRYNSITVFVYITLFATGVKAADSPENPENKKKSVFFHLNRSPKYGQLPERAPEPQSHIAPGGARLDSESQSGGQILHKQPPEDLSDD